MVYVQTLSEYCIPACSDRIAYLKEIKKRKKVKLECRGLCSIHLRTRKARAAKQTKKEGRKEKEGRLGRVGKGMEEEQKTMQIANYFKIVKFRKHVVRLPFRGGFLRNILKGSHGSGTQSYPCTLASSSSSSPPVRTTKGPAVTQVGAYPHNTPWYLPTYLPT